MRVVNIFTVNVYTVLVIVSSLCKRKQWYYTSKKNEDYTAITVNA